MHALNRVTELTGEVRVRQGGEYRLAVLQGGTLRTGTTHQIAECLTPERDSLNPSIHPSLQQHPSHIVVGGLAGAVLKEGYGAIHKRLDISTHIHLHETQLQPQRSKQAANSPGD